MANIEFPIYKKSVITGMVVEFTEATVGRVFISGSTNNRVGLYSRNWIHYTNHYWIPYRIEDNHVEHKEDMFRPNHYAKGKDTFAWAEEKFDTDTCLAIAAFNIHKYNDRDKGQDFNDFGKIADYANWARKLMEKDSK